MNSGDKTKPSQEAKKQKPKKGLVAATHILKKVALQRYREKHAGDIVDYEFPSDTKSNITDSASLCGAGSSMQEPTKSATDSDLKLTDIDLQSNTIHPLEDQSKSESENDVGISNPKSSLVEQDTTLQTNEKPSEDIKVALSPVEECSDDKSKKTLSSDVKSDSALFSDPTNCSPEPEINDSKVKAISISDDNDETRSLDSYHSGPLQSESFESEEIQNHVEGQNKVDESLTNEINSFNEQNESELIHKTKPDDEESNSGSLGKVHLTEEYKSDENKTTVPEAKHGGLDEAKTFTHDGDHDSEAKNISDHMGPPEIEANFVTKTDNKVDDTIASLSFSPYHEFDLNEPELVGFDPIVASCLKEDVDGSDMSSSASNEADAVDNKGIPTAHSQKCMSMGNS